MSAFLRGILRLGLVMSAFVRGILRLWLNNVCIFKGSIIRPARIVS